MMSIICIILMILHFRFSISENVHMTKVFILPIEPEIFNWTEKGNDRYSYQPSLQSAPDLPSWMQYTYSERHQIGLLYGVPPLNHRDLTLEIVGLDRKTYETRQRDIHINVNKKDDPAKYEVQLKIHNLNVEDMFDSRRLDRLLGIFRKKLWTESDEDLYVTFLASAVQLGGRLPLRPGEEEGVVMRIGSTAPFSSLLVELQEEVRPLWKRGSCPRDFKRTTVEWLFRDAGLALDWCAFRLIEGSSSSGLKHSSRHDAVLPPGARGLPPGDRWQRPDRSQVPRRSYVGEFLLTIAVPMVVLVLLALLLSFILCFHREGIGGSGSGSVTRGTCGAGAGGSSGRPRRRSWCSTRRPSGPRRRCARCPAGGRPPPRSGRACLARARPVPAARWPAALPPGCWWSPALTIVRILPPTPALREALAIMQISD
ncbi:epsilon-sarcoglycan isoform X2 [Bacillus rossius redtenbacheri]|uniref:epsilon-sarcoglycan isoform X2 n=1 Tax=Bacillus rossius redtenbacheri TaxID=93214 RepID=UPI002FDD182D